MLTSPLSKIELIDHDFKLTTPKEEIVICDYDLMRFFDEKERYLQTAQAHWKEGFAHFKEPDPLFHQTAEEYLLSDRSLRVFEAWQNKNNKVWTNSLPAFLEKFPTYEALKKAASKENTPSSAPAHSIGAGKKSR